MNQNKALVAAFGGTLAILLLAFLGLQALAGGAGTGPAPTPVVIDIPTPTAGSATPTPTTGPTATAEQSAKPTNTPSATRTPRPTATPPPIGPGNKVKVVVTGQQYVKADVPSNGTVTKLGGGALRISTTRDLSDPLTLTYKLPAASLPAGAKIRELDVDVCGFGEGDFWETYGPFGADEYEFEVTNPTDGSGCWHYRNAPGSDSTVLAAIHLQSTFRIDRLVYTVTLD
jgi:hypothetical protein